MENVRLRVVTYSMKHYYTLFQCLRHDAHACIWDMDEKNANESYFSGWDNDKADINH